MSLLAKTWQALDTDRSLPPSPPSADPDNATSAPFSMFWGDPRRPGTVREYQRNIAVDRLKHPIPGGSTAGVGPYQFWPDKRVEPPVRIGDRGPSNVLMVHNGRAPSAPSAGAQKPRRAFGERATLVKAGHGRHGVHPFGRTTCANDAVTAFLSAGQRPSRDLGCAAEPSE